MDDNCKKLQPSIDNALRARTIKSLINMNQIDPTTITPNYSKYFILEPLSGNDVYGIQIVNSYLYGYIDKVTVY